MSKAKKIISMLLAVAMVLTVAPVSLSASAATIVEPSPSFTFQEFSVDTSATTKVLRVAAGAGSFSLGDQIVAATASGIPSNGGTYASVAYAGESPITPKVVFTISGASLAEPPSVKSSLTDCSFNAVQKTTNSDGSTTYTWEISTGTASVGTDVVFTITYKVGTTEYQAYAYSHVENILVMNGFLSYKKNENGTEGTGRHALIVQLQSRNMYSGMCQDSSVSNRVVGYINYATTSGDDGTNLTGCGSSADLSTTATAYASAAPNDAIQGTEQGVMIKSVSDSTGTQRNMCYNNDTNKSESVVYIDRRTDATLADLNMRMTVQNGEKADFSTAYVQDVFFYSGHKTFGDEDSSFTSDAAATAIMGISGTGSGNAISGNSTYGWVTLPFSGTGPTTLSDSEQQYSLIVNLYSNANGRTSRCAGGINLDFYVYDTSDLYGMYSGALRGTGTYTCTTAAYSGAVLTFNKGVNPQASMYTNGWSAYETAMKEAGRILSTPDTNQAAIDAAALNLYNAYNALEGYYEETVFKVHYMDNSVLDASGNPTHLTKADGTEAIYSYIKDSGTTMVVSPTNVTGYTVTDNAPKSAYASGKATATETGSDGVTRAVIDVYFYFNPSNYNVNAYTGTEDAGVKIYQYAYGSTVETYTESTETVNGVTYTNYTSLLETGTKANYSFAGWYFDQEYTQSAKSFSMPAAPTTIFAKWVPTPIKINAIPVVDGQQLDAVEVGRVTPNEDPLISTAFAKPADLELSGYLFVDYFVDAELTTPVTWPLRFTIGDTDTTIYARMVDVTGKIIFESNGGSAVPDVEYTAPAEVEAPEDPIKQGYTFAGWYEKQNLSGDPISWPVTMNNETGFIAYAAWTPNEYTISFDIGTAVTKYDTVAIAAIEPGPADTLIPKDFYPNEPLKFGYVFDGWSLNGVRYEFDGTNTYPTENITLKALWRTTDHAAFADITAYEKLSGNYVETDTASVGDVVTFRMSAMTNFYSGSSVFVFMYDSNFFELVDEGTDAFVINKENNEYLSGIDAKINGVTDSSVLPWPDGLDSTNYKAMMITIDPTVTMDNYNCEPMSDGEWMVEFQLKVKDTATGSGTVYMDNAWTRTQDNIMGTQFISWADSDEASVADTYNNVVTPILDDATATITIDEVIPEDTTITLWSNAENEATASKGAWIAEDGTVVSEMVYTGRAETEIMDFVEPTREGYTLTGWYYKDDETVKLGAAAGYYASEEIKDRIYIAEWTPIEYTINYYTEQTDGVLYYSELVGYELNPAGPEENPTKTGYTFAGWVDEGGNAVDLSTYTCPLNGASLYATWAPATDTAYTLKIIYTNVSTGAEGSTTQAMTGTTDATVIILETAPATPADNTIYIEWANLPVVANGNFVFDKDKNPAEITGVIAPDGSTVIEVYYKGKDVTFTYDANGGKFADGSTTKTEVKEWQSLAEGPGEEPTRTGYTFNGWAGVTFGTTRMTADGTKKANWTVNKYPVTFDANGGAWDDATTTQKVEVAYNSSITAPTTSPSKTGYDFLGWASTSTATAAEALGTMDTTDAAGKTFYAVYALTEYKVTYYVDGTETYVDPYHMGDTVTVRAAESKTGYSFSGWLNGGVDAGTSFTMSNADVVLEGTFTANYYDVIFDATGGYFDGDTAATTKAVSTQFDNAITPPAAPTRNGYKFLGWAADGTTDIITNYGYLTTTDTVEFDAVWEATVAEYTINVYYQDVNGVYPENPDETSTSSGLVATTASVAHEDKTGFSADTANSVLSGTIDADNPLVLVVKYTRNQYVLKTNVDGTVEEVDTYYYQAEVAEPAAPADKTGHTFAGWSGYTEGMTMPAAETTLTATWTKKSYVVTWNVDGATTTNTYEYEAAIQQPVTPTKTGHTFDKWVWTDTDTGASVDAPSTMPAYNVTATATWTVNSYTVTYRTYNGVYKTESVAYGETIVLPEDPTREGYSFTGWSGYTEGMTMPAAQQVFLAQWQINQYTVTYADTGDTTIAGVTADYGTAIDTVDDPTKTGYTFGGWVWTKTETGETVTAPTTIPAYNVTATAQWTINQYTVTYADTGDTTIAGVTADYGTAIDAVEDPTKTGHTFNGWVWTNTDTGATVTAPTTIPAYNVTATAQWTVNSYDITWVDGTSTETENLEYGAAVTIDTLSKEGYTFNGWAWTKTEGGTAEAAPSTMPAYDLTATAQWTINQYKAVFNSGDGAYADSTTSKEVMVNYGETPVAPETPSKVGYSFAGWTPALAPMGIDGATYTATYTAGEVSYTIETYTMDTEGAYGTPVTETKTGTADTPATVTPVAETGFTLDTEGSILSGNIEADGSLVLEVYFIRNQYALYTKEDADGEATKVADYYFGETVAKPADPAAREGYTFDGWDGYTDGMTMPAAETTLTAKWTTNTYDVTWIVDGETIKTDTVAYGASVTAPADPEKTGHTFASWSWTKTEGGAAESAPTTMPAYDLTATATWTVNTYTITWDLDDSADTDELVEETLSYGASITMKDDPVKEHYTFEGWIWTNADTGEVIEAVTEMPDYNIKITADMERVPVTLELIAGSTAVVDTETNGAIVPGTEDDPVYITGYIYGLETKLSESTVRSKYLSVKGDGELIITLTKFRVCGTGSKVEVYDNVEQRVVETYYIIIFGDLNGDSNVDAIDFGMADDEAGGLTTWSLEEVGGVTNEAYDHCKVFAGDIGGGVNDDGSIGDGSIGLNDAAAIRDVKFNEAEINQQTGEVVYS